MPPTKKAQVESGIKITDKRVSQWENLMKRFSRAHDGACRRTALKMPLARRSTKYFPTGSNYSGTWDVLGMSGHGVYTFNSGVVYEGDFEDGMFHGVGQFRYPDGTIVRGHFDKGVMKDRKIIFADGLTYKEENWTYCKMPDRRYTIEYKEGVPPAGVSNITAAMPPRTIPPGFYDTGDGMYDPKTKTVYKADDLFGVVRAPTAPEQRWIMENCRTAPETVLGPRPDLYEEWSVPQLRCPHSSPPTAETQMLSLSRRLSSERGYSLNDDDYEFLDSEKCDKYLKRESVGYKHTTSNLCGKKSSVSVHSNFIEKMKRYNKRVVTEDSHLRFSTLPTNYSELYSKNIPIEVAVAAVVQKPNNPAFKYSDVYMRDTVSKKTELTFKKPVKEIPESKLIKENLQFKLSDKSNEFSDASIDSDDMLPIENEFSFDSVKSLTKSQSYNKNKPEYLGLTSSVLMFKNADSVKTRAGKDKSSGGSSNASEVQISAWETTQHNF